MWMQAAQGAISYIAKRKQAKVQASWDRYNNAMAGIQAGQANNAITLNVALNREQHAENKLAIQTSKLMAAASVKAGAAAAGVAGGSVEATIFDIGRNAGKKLHAEESRFETSLLVTDKQRRDISMSRKLSQRQVTKGPNLLSAIATTGFNILGDDTTPTSNGTNLEARNTSDPWANLRNMLS